MKNILFIIGVFISSLCQAQSYKVGKIDADGKIQLSIDQTKSSNILNQISFQKTATVIQVNDLSFTRLSRGQICLTGYEKDASGKILKGIRIQCTQDDENNLIVVSTNPSERIAGKAFNEESVQN